MNILSFLPGEILLLQYISLLFVPLNERPKNYIFPLTIWNVKTFYKIYSSNYLIGVITNIDIFKDNKLTKLTADSNWRI